MVRLFFNIWPFAIMKIIAIIHNFAKVSSVFCLIRNELSKFCQRLINFCLSVKISPNVVTLFTRSVCNLNPQLPSPLYVNLSSNNWNKNCSICTALLIHIFHWLGSFFFDVCNGHSAPVWPDLAIFWTLGNFLKPLAAINLLKSPNILRQFL